MKSTKALLLGFLALSTLFSQSSSRAAGDGVLTMHPAFELSYETLTNRAYQLQSTTNSADANSWTNVGVGQIGTGGTVSELVSTQGASNRFFRVQIFGFTEGLVARYKLDGDADDTSVHANHGVATSPMATTNRFGAVNSAMSFNGLGDRVLAPDAPQQTLTNALTMSAWVNFESGGTHGPRILHKDTGSNGYQLVTEGTGGTRTFRSVIVIEGVGQVFVDSATTFSEGNWHHVVATYDGTSSKLYVDGSLEGQVAIAGTITPSTAPLAIGRNGIQDTDRFRGSIDDVRIYDRALSAAEVAILHGLP